MRDYSYNYYLYFCGEILWRISLIALLTNCSKNMSWTIFSLFANAKPKWNYCALMSANNLPYIAKIKNVNTPMKSTNFAERFSCKDWQSCLIKGWLCIRNFWRWFKEWKRTLSQGCENRERKHSINLFSENFRMNKSSLLKIYS